MIIYINQVRTNEWSNKLESIAEPWRMNYVPVEVERMPAHNERWNFSTEQWDEIPPDYSEQAVQARDSAIDSPLPLLDALWDVDSTARERMLLSIEGYETDPSLGDTRNWRLYDNSWRVTTVAELRQVRAAYVARMADVFAQFELWDDGAKDQPFAPVF